MARRASERRETRSSLWLALLVVLSFVLGLRTCAVAFDGDVDREARVWHEERPPVTPPRIPPLPHYPHRSESPSVDVFADVDQPVEELRTFAEDALVRLREWMSVPTDGRRPPHYSLYLSGSLETMGDLEEAKGLVRSARRPNRTFAFRGGFYAQASMISLRCDAGQDMRHLIAHELSHAAFHEKVGKDCDAINEGLAMYNATRILGWSQPGELLGITEWWRHRGASSLRRLFSLDYWQFRDDRTDYLYFSVSTILARILLEDGHPGIEGRFPGFLARLRTMEPWDAFRRTYDVALVEEKWKRSIEVLAEWEPVFGEWTIHGDVIGANVEGGGGAVLVRRAPLAAGHPLQISCKLLSSLDDDGEFGFVVGYRGYEDYTAVVLRPRDSTLFVARRCGPVWESRRILTLEFRPAHAISDELSLHSDGAGLAVLCFGPRVLASFSLDARDLEGRAGLFVDPPPKYRDDAGWALFEMGRVSEDAR